MHAEGRARPHLLYGPPRPSRAARPPTIHGPCRQTWREAPRRIRPARARPGEAPDYSRPPLARRVALQS